MSRATRQNISAPVVGNGSDSGAGASCCAGSVEVGGSLLRMRDQVFLYWASGSVVDMCAMKAAKTWRHAVYSSAWTRVVDILRRLREQKYEERERWRVGLSRREMRREGLVLI